MFSKIYRKGKSNQRNQTISKYVRETGKGTPRLHLKNRKRASIQEVVQEMKQMKNVNQIDNNDIYT